MRRKAKTRRFWLETIEPRLMMASISGAVFNDLDGNGIRNGEPGLSNWTVFLDQNRDHILNNGEISTTTSATGQYTFDGLAPANYTVAQVIPTGWVQTHPGGAPSFSAFVPSNQASSIPSKARRARDSDVIRGAINTVSNLGSYTVAQIRSARSWVVGLPQGATIDALTAAVGPINVVPSTMLEDTYIMNFSERALGTTIATRLGAAAGLSFFYPLVGFGAKSLRAIPDDPLFPNQWHLLNNGQTAGTPGADANVTPVWDTYKGDGVTIAVVDEGMEYTHEDLSPNYSAALSWDYWSNDNNPAAGAGENHATSVGGVAAGRGFNGKGISGAAPDATLAAIRLVVGNTSDLQESNGLSHMSNSISIYNNSWGPIDDGVHIEAPGPLTAATLQNGALNGRNGKGNIFVWAAGNGKGSGGLQGDNVNYDGYANSRYVVAVSAIDHNGIQSYYSEPGAPILVAGYSDGNAGIVTTDRTGSAGYSSGNYTSTFGGTSSASPLVAGVVALMLQANPNLGWRDVQQILAHSAKKNSAADADWTTNGAGLHVNHKYGFGAIDAQAAVALAQNWVNVGPEQLVTSGTLNVNTLVPDNDANGLTRTFDVTSPLRVEDVEVVFNATHATRGQLKLILTSPSGTQSVLSDFHNDSGDNWSNWVFTTRRNLDELAAGTWSLKVIDGTGANTGTWNSWKLNLYGTVPDATVHYAVVNSADSLSDLDFGAHDVAAPTIASSLFNFATGQSITVQFNEDVSGTLSADDLNLNNLTRSEVVPNGSIAMIWNGANNTATFTFPGFVGGILPDGNYHATLSAAGFTDLSGNHMSADATLDFFVLGGDANRDRKVDVEDLGILSTNWQSSSSVDFTLGDFDYSGTVDVNDLGILATNWQVNLPAASPSLAALGTSRVARSTIRIASQVL